MCFGAQRWVIWRYHFALCLSLLYALAPARAETPTPEEQHQFAEKFLTDRLGIWKRELNLEDWRIAIVLAKRCELKPRTLGAIRFEKQQKSAVIWVLDPNDYRLGFREALGDMEFTILHELVHLDLRSRQPKIANRSGEEKTVNRITSTLLKSRPSTDTL